MICQLCHRNEVTSKKPDRYPYCQWCHYDGSVAEHVRANQMAYFRTAFPEAIVSVDHTGGGCFWLSFKFEDGRFYIATDGEASLPYDPETGDEILEGGWGYVGELFGEDMEESRDLFSCTGEPPEYKDTGERVSDRRVMELIFRDHRREGVPA